MTRPCCLQGWVLLSQDQLAAICLLHAMPSESLYALLLLTCSAGAARDSSRLERLAAKRATRRAPMLLASWQSQQAGLVLSYLPVQRATALASAQLAAQLRAAVMWSRCPAKHAHSTALHTRSALARNAWLSMQLVRPPNMINLATITDIMHSARPPARAPQLTSLCCTSGFLKLPQAVKGLGQLQLQGTCRAHHCCRKPQLSGCRPSTASYMHTLGARQLQRHFSRTVLFVTRFGCCRCLCSVCVTLSSSARRYGRIRPL